MARCFSFSNEAFSVSMLKYGGVNRLNINQSFALAQPICVGNVNKETEALGHCGDLRGFSVRAKVSRNAAHQGTITWTINYNFILSQEVPHDFLAIKKSWLQITRVNFTFKERNLIGSNLTFAPCPFVLWSHPIMEDTPGLRRGILAKVNFSRTLYWMMFTVVKKRRKCRL